MSLKDEGLFGQVQLSVIFHNTLLFLLSDFVTADVL